MDRQIVLTEAEWREKHCPACGATLEIIEGHWLLRDCALCAWCRRWYGRPEMPGENSSVQGFNVTVEPAGRCPDCGEPMGTLGRCYAGSVIDGMPGSGHRERLN
jgi:hypothetical protein